MRKFFCKLRVHYKLIKRKFVCINSFCKECGVDVRDFSAPDEVWAKVEPEIKYGYTLCYNCFCDFCCKWKLPSCWKLDYLEK